MEHAELLWALLCPPMYIIKRRLSSYLQYGVLILTFPASLSFVSLSESFYLSLLPFGHLCWTVRIDKKRKKEEKMCLRDVEKSSRFMERCDDGMSIRTSGKKEHGLTEGKEIRGRVVRIAVQRQRWLSCWVIDRCNNIPFPPFKKPHAWHAQCVQ